MCDVIAPAATNEINHQETQPQLNGNNQNLPRFPGHQDHAFKSLSWWVTVQLAYQSIGVVYGDIGTSPLYVYPSTFTNGVKHTDDVLGVLSLILYTLTFIPLLKYVFIVLHANFNGHGGTMALYSLICQYAKVSLIPEDHHASQFECPTQHFDQWTSKLKSKLEKSWFAKFFLLFATMLGSSMVIGDGIFTPCISVLSAVTGIKEAATDMTQDSIVWISVGILVCLFMFQRFGTDRVSHSFAPIICVWFTLIGSIGFYNFIKYDPTVLKALNPKHIIDYFTRNGQEAWISLGGIVLSTTGAEALYADVGHFTVGSIQISMCTVTYPVLIWAYTGQAAFLRKHSDLVSHSFFKSIPGPLYWPMFVVAVLSSIIASQAMISGTFSIIQQAISLGFFPPVKIVHTSAKYEGRVYIPLVNYFLMLSCIGVTLGFRSTTKIGNAYGISVVIVMTLTSFLLLLAMRLIWKLNTICITGYVFTIGLMELLYLSSVIYKFGQGGYLPLAFSAILTAIMYIWNHVHRRKYYYEVEHKISADELKHSEFIRATGLAFFYGDPSQDIPLIFKHYVTNMPALNSVIIFISIKSLPILKVEEKERFHFQRVGPKELNMFSCVARYGYMDAYSEQLSFERVLIENLKEFIRQDFWITKWVTQIYLSDEQVTMKNETLEELVEREWEREREIEIVDKAWDGGVVHFITENEVIAGEGASFGKRFLIDYAYNFLNKNLGQSNKVFDIIPRKRLLKVGMTYEL